MKRRQVLTAMAACGLQPLAGCVSTPTGRDVGSRERAVDDGLTQDVDSTATRRVFDVGAHRSVWGAKGVVSTANHHATRVGMQILMRGGNAIDAAVAASAAGSVSEPYMSGIGGWGGYMLLYIAREQRVLALDMMGRSPLGGVPAGPDKATGYRSCIVPGTVAGWSEVLRRYGTMSLGDVLEPAVEIADDGFVLSPYDALKFSTNVAKLRRNADAQRVFLPGGEAPRVGMPLRQKDLAQTFRAIARNGADELYRGALGHEIVRYLQANGGLITLRDLESYQLRWREPIHIEFRGNALFGMGPGSCSMTMFQALNVIDELGLAPLQPYSEEFAHYWIEALRLAFIDDDRFNTAKDGVDVPVARLISRSYAREQLRAIDRTKASARLGPPMPMVGTTHLSTADRFGNVVSYTNSLGAEFGSGVVAGRTGVTLNNGLDLGFHPSPAHVNALAPGHIAKGIMSPVIALRDGRPVLAAGAAGGYTIPQTVGQVVLKVLAGDMDVQEAIASPRVVLNFKSPGSGDADLMQRAWLHFDPTYPADVQHAMRRKGFLPAPPTAHTGAVQAVYVDTQTRMMAAGADPRRGGSAMAW